MAKLRFFSLLLCLAILASLVGGAFPSTQAAAADGTEPQGPGDPAYPEAGQKQFLPLVSRPLAYQVSGKVSNQGGAPIPGVTVTAATGETAVTDSQGNYQFNALPAGPNAISPNAPALAFNPAVQEVTVNGNLTGVSFVAASTSELIVNGGFESTSGWNLPVTAYTAVYATAQKHSGSHSMRTGIVDTAQNRYSYSTANQKVTIPANATNVKLRLWLYPRSGEPAAALPPPPQVGEGILMGETPQFNEAVEASDVQYVLILDSNGVNLETLVWMRSNNQFWTSHEFNLTQWRGRTIIVSIGTYNDGAGGVTAMYADDVSLTASTDTPPPPPTCQNGLTNSGFESNSAWNIPATAWPAGYSVTRAHSGARSMRTGIVDQSQRRTSYSDAWQYVTIAANATTARMKMWYYPLSGEVAALAEGASEMAPPPQPEAKTIEEFYNTAVASDAQYVLVLDSNGNILEYLLWFKSNAGAWKYNEVDLLKYKGSTIRLLFGTYNDNANGVTSMYVDDMVVEFCTGTPPPGCSNYMLNGGFENTSAWYLPWTAYTAGYSTAFARTGARSMRTGIYYQSHNRYAYSDARQTVTLPSNPTKALLSFYMYPRSTDGNDRQYLLILDQWGNWIDTLVWQVQNYNGWVYKEFGLKAYAGETIQINFGTYNDGYNGVTAMYVDDVRLDVCVP